MRGHFVPAPAVSVLAPAGVVVQASFSGMSRTFFLLLLRNCNRCREMLGIGVAVGAFVGPAVSRQAEIGSCVDISFLLRPSLFWPQRESASKPASAACLGHSSCCCSAIEIVVERCLV